MSMQSTFLSVDLDDIECYRAIHGLPDDLSEGLRDLVFERWLPRLFETLDDVPELEASARATLFVIGREVERDLDGQGKGAALLRQALADGYELGHHGYAHDYRLAKASARAIAADIDRGDRALAALGARAIGYRAPGHIRSHALSKQIAAKGFVYDSSALPSPAYLLAKLGVMSFMQLRGRRSASSWSGVSGFFGRTLPSIRSNGVWDIPISVTDTARLPFIGALSIGAPERLHRAMANAAQRMPMLHLQLHAIDFADLEADGLPKRFASLQPELRIPLATRIDRLKQLLSRRGGAAPLASMLPAHVNLGRPLSSKRSSDGATPRDPDAASTGL